MLFFSREMLVQFPGCFHIHDQGQICRYYDGIDNKKPNVFALVEFL
jgi:hypothetical protein